MSVFHDHEIREILYLARENRSLLRRILAHLGLQPLTRSIVIEFTGEFGMQTSNLVLNVGQTSQASIVPLLADGVTNSGGALSSVSFSFSDPSATVVLNSDNLTATVTGVAASAGPVSGTASCTVTDTDGVVSTWTKTFTIQVNAVAPPPPQQLTQSIEVQFTDPA